MKDSILQDLKYELIKGYAKRGHPFRYFTLATVRDSTPCLRTVVLRQFLPDFTAIVYTDLRSQKVRDIQQNNNVSGLFYHPKKLLQIKLEGQAEIITDETALRAYWDTVGENAKKDYTTSNAPGTRLKNPDHVEYLEDRPNFCVLKLKCSKIEYLHLKRPNHIRVLFTNTNGHFSGEFLVP